MWFKFPPDNEIFHLGKWLPPQIELKFMFHFNWPEFFLNCVGLNGRVHKDDIKMQFHLQQIEVAPTLYASLEKARHVDHQMVTYATVRHKC